MQKAGKLLLSISLLLCFALLYSARIKNELLISFLDIGQGDAIFLDYQGFQVLVDGGPDTRIIEELRSVMPIGDKTIDWLVLSHPDADHISGLLDVVDSYAIERVFMPKVKKQTQLFAAWEKKLIEKQIPVVFIDSERTIQIASQYQISFLHPTPETMKDSFTANNYSLVMHVQYDEMDFLLPGDIEQEVEELFVNTYTPFDIEVLKSPHHGSKSSSSIEFLSMLQPEVVVIQSGEENKFGHPHHRVLSRYKRVGATILRNDQLGSIYLSTDGKSIWSLSKRLPIFPQLFGFHKETLYNTDI